MDASADADVLLFAFRFAADIVWYPEIATSLCSLRVSGLFFDCFLDGEVIPGAEERASHIARILASILNIHTTWKPYAILGKKFAPWSADTKIRTSILLGGSSLSFPMKRSSFAPLSERMPPRHSAFGYPR